MTDFPYTMSPKHLRGFFLHIQRAGIPPKVTFKYLQQVGFKSSWDRRIIKILKFIGFINSSGVPNTRWKNYRDKSKAKKVLAVAVKEAYIDLFSTFPDAYRKDDEALQNYFSAHTNLGGRALRAVVDTFKTLCELSDFEVPLKVPTEKEIPEEPEKRKKRVDREFALNINIQLQLPATEDASIYDKLFAALKKHLFPD